MRRIPEYSRGTFGEELMWEKWERMTETMNPSMLVCQYNTFNKGLIDKHFPMKKIRIFKYDKPWMTEKLHGIRRGRHRVYEKAPIGSGIWTGSSMKQKKRSC